MSYLAIDQLTVAPLFQARVRACAVQQAAIFRDDSRPYFQALASDVARGSASATFVFIRIAAGAPGHAEKAMDGEGVDQSRITDEDILAVVQPNWEVVALLFFDNDGNRLEL
jgi:hypothetical protein